MQSESLIPKENIFFGDNLIFFGGGHMDGRTEGCTDRGDHMSHVNISSVIFQYSAMGFRFRSKNSISRR